MSWLYDVNRDPTSFWLFSPIFKFLFHAPVMASIAIWSSNHHVLVLVGKKEKDKGQKKKRQKLDKSVFQKAFPNPTQWLFFFLTYYCPELCYMTIPISREAGKYVLGKHIAAPTNWDFL